MKLLLTFDFPPDKGGIQKYLYGIVKHTFLKRDLVLIPSSTRTNYSNNSLTATVKSCSFPISLKKSKLHIVNALIPFLKIVLKSKGTVTVVCGNIYAAILPWILYPVTRKTYSVFTYGSELLPLKKITWKSFFLRSVLFHAKEIYTISEYTRTLLIDIGCKHRIEMIVPKIEINSLPQKPEFNTKPPIRLLSVGRLVYHKGFEVLLNALSLLTQKESSFRLTIAGNGPDFFRLLQLSKSLSVSSIVDIKQGLTDNDLTKEYLQSNIFVLPSLETERGVEGFGIVLLEAMAMHTPIVAAASGGIPEVIDNGTCGILVEPNSPKALAQAILSLALDVKAMRLLTQKAYTRLKTHYVWNQ